jgi:curved DNA-binding protein CbpA
MKDYYRTLGILDDAEDIIIRAAYRALAQRYHPDKWVGDKVEATKRMAEINEAYEVLSDHLKRTQYDREFFKSTNRNQAEENIKDQGNNFEIDDEWEIATTFQKQLTQQYNELNKISPRLANTFKVELLLNQNFSSSADLKNKLEKEYLNKFYGDEPRIQNLAKALLLRGYTSEAIAINKIVRVLGANITYDDLIVTIEKDFPKAIEHLNRDKSQQSLENKLRGGMKGFKDGWNAEKKPPPKYAFKWWHVPSFFLCAYFYYMLVIEKSHFKKFIESLLS